MVLTNLPLSGHVGLSPQKWFNVLPSSLPPSLLGHKVFWELLVKMWHSKRRVAEWPQYRLGCRTSSGFSPFWRNGKLISLCPHVQGVRCALPFLRSMLGTEVPHPQSSFLTFLWSLDAVCRWCDKKASVPLLVFFLGGGHPCLYLMHCQACWVLSVFDWVTLGCRLRFDEVKPRWPPRSGSASAYTLCFLSF